VEATDPKGEEELESVPCAKTDDPMRTRAVAGGRQMQRSLRDMMMTNLTDFSKDARLRSKI
jgi:hypothetical protein